MTRMRQIDDDPLGLHDTEQGSRFLTSVWMSEIRVKNRVLM